MSRVYIVDIDGTIADLSHRKHFIERNPKEWDHFYDEWEFDKPIIQVISLIRIIGFRTFHEDDLEIVYVTGRPERIRDETSRFLMRHGLPNGTMLMREDGDHRSDEIVKKELYEIIVQKGGKVIGVFEDRPSVCRMWRELGLTVYQVNDKEF